MVGHDGAYPPGVHIMDVATFGATCSPCSTQFTKHWIVLEHSAQFPDAVSAIVDRTYVDDCFDSLNSEEEVLRRDKEVRFINSKAGFEVRNRSSNSSPVLSGLGEKGSVELVHFHWNPQLDTLSLTVPSGREVSLDHSI